MNSFKMSHINISLKPLFFMSRMFGLLPLSFSVLDVEKGEVFSFRVSDVCFLLLWILVSLTMIGCNLYYAIYCFPSVPKKLKFHSLFMYSSFH